MIRVDREEERLGGTAAVAMIASSLGAEVTLAGVVGRDSFGEKMLAMLEEHDIDSHIWQDDRPTTWKQRIVARGQIRPDRCDREETTPIGDAAAKFLADVPVGDALLTQDYGKGVCTKRLLSHLVQRAKAERVPVLVDPARSRDWSDYGEVTLIKANWIEATECVGSTELDALDLARQLSVAHECHVIVTLGAQGLVCAEWNGKTWRTPAMHAEIRDVCGAGDTILAAFGKLLAQGCSLRKACRHAVTLAAMQVSQLGIAKLAG